MRTLSLEEEKLNKHKKHPSTKALTLISILSFLELLVFYFNVTRGEFLKSDNKGSTGWSDNFEII